MSRLDRERSRLRHIHPALGEAGDLLIGSGLSCGQLIRDMCDTVLDAAYGRVAPKVADRARVLTLIELYTRAVEGTEPFRDLLGALYMGVAASTGHKKALGQFFTPEHVASMMAQLAMPETGHACVTGRLVRVSEPACGSGVMVLQTCRWIVAGGSKESLKGYAIWANDLDPLCARMCAVQMMAQDSIHQMPFGELLVTCGDALVGQRKQVLLHASLVANRAALAQAA